MSVGLREVLPGLIVDCCPVGDGGEGTLAALLGAQDGKSVSCRVQGSDGKPVDAAFGIFETLGFSFVESASAIGLHPDEHQRDVMNAT